MYKQTNTICKPKRVRLFALIIKLHNNNENKILYHTQRLNPKIATIFTISLPNEKYNTQ